jgi:cell division protein FtsX
MEGAFPGTKGHLQSLTINSAIVVLISTAINLLTPYTIDDATTAQWVQLFSAVAGLAGGTGAWIGRVRATKKIGPPPLPTKGG